MKKFICGLLVVAATAALMVPLALAGGGNSDAAKACQQDGWKNLARQDGTSFKNTGDCVSYAAQGGVLVAKSTGGSENFSGFGDQSQPTTFSGGTIDPALYAAGLYPAGGAILVAGPYFNGFATGTHFLFTGLGVNQAKLTLTNPASRCSSRPSPTRRASRRT